MKIGMFTDGYLPGITGVATSVADLVRELERRGHEVSLVAPKYPGYRDTRPVTRIPALPLPTQKNLRIATYLPGTSLVLASQMDVDIVHGHAGGPITIMGWEVAKLRRVPFVFTYHTMFTQYTHYVMRGKVIRPKMAEGLTRMAANAADVVIAPTEKVHNELLSYGVKKPVLTIPSGIDLNKFRPQKTGFLHSSWHIPQNKKLLIFVGRLGKEKSVDYLLRSFAIVASHRLDTDLVIVGDGPDRSKLEAQARQLSIQNRVHFTGMIDPNDVQKAYADADMLVFCSRTETQGLAIFEAFACGLPVIVVDDPAYQGIVRPNENGLIARRGVQGFARAVEGILDDPDAMRAMSAGALLTAKDFSLETAVDKLESLYKQLIRE